MKPLVICLALAAMASTDGSEDDSLIVFVEVSLNSNLSQLLAGTFEFEVVHGKARSSADALRGEIENPVTASGSYRFNERNAMYKRNYTDAAILENTPNYPVPNFQPNT